WHGLEPHEPAAALRPSRCYFQPCPHHRLRPVRRPTTTATFASSRFSRHRHSLSARLARSPPCRSATPLTHIPFRIITFFSPPSFTIRSPRSLSPVPLCHAPHAHPLV